MLTDNARPTGYLADLMPYEWPYFLSLVAGIRADTDELLADKRARATQHRVGPYLPPSGGSTLFFVWRSQQNATGIAELAKHIVMFLCRGQFGPARGAPGAHSPTSPAGVGGGGGSSGHPLGHQT